MATDKMVIEVLEDGTIKVDTDKISMPNHVSAERFLAQMFFLAGGTIAKRAKHGLSHLLGHKHSHGQSQGHGH
jgi:hypothetical protein